MPPRTWAAPGRKGWRLPEWQRQESRNACRASVGYLPGHSTRMRRRGLQLVGLPGAPGVADPVARAGTAARRAILRIRQPARLQRETAAPDAACKAFLQALQLGNPLVHPRVPSGRQSRPVGPLGDAVRRQPCQLGADFLERQTDSLSEHDEGDPAQHGARKPAMAGAGTFRRDQALLFVKPQRGRGNAAAAGHFGDGQDVAHVWSKIPLDLKFTLTCRLGTVNQARLKADTTKELS